MRKVIKILLQMTLLPLVVLSLFRLVYILLFVPFNTLSNYNSSWLMIAWNSLRFDMQTIAYIVILPFMLFMLCFMGRKQMLILRICRIYFTVCMILLSILGIVDIGFYLNFNSHININFFDFSNSNGAISSIRKNVAIWYYALRNLAIAILLVVGIRLLGEKISRILSI